MTESPPQNSRESHDAATEREWTPEEYAWSCAEDMRDWAIRAEDAARDLREENYALRREVAELRNQLRSTTLELVRHA